MKIIFKNVSKRFKKVEVLNDVNITFVEGKIYGLMGRNGTGKSVFLKMLCGLYKPTSGSISIDGETFNRFDKCSYDIRALIERPNFFPDLTGFENLKLLSNIQKKITDDDIIKTLQDVNLINEKDKKYSEYSVGMKQKLGLAQVFMENPKIIVLDEPFNGIEEESVKKISNKITEEKNKNKIIIISTHIKEDLTYLSDEIYLFDDTHVTKINEDNR